MTQERARAILHEGDEQQMSGVCEGDFITSVCDGLKQYLEDYRPWGQEGDQDKGPLFKQVVSVWAEPEDGLKWPGAAVYTVGEARYTEAGFTPLTEGEETIRVAGVECLLVTVCTMSVSVAVEVYCNNPDQRQRLMAWYERALFPNMQSGGLLLELPNYYKARVQVSPKSTRYMDSSESAQKRHRLARSLLEVTGPSVVPYPAKRITVKAKRTED